VASLPGAPVHDPDCQRRTPLRAIERLAAVLVAAGRLGPALEPDQCAAPGSCPAMGTGREGNDAAIIVTEKGHAIRAQLRAELRGDLHLSKGVERNTAGDNTAPYTSASLERALKYPKASIP
jgi:hypothetical protein